MTVNTCVRLSAETINWNVYPNPAKDIVNINFIATENAAYTLNMFDASGRMVISKQMNAFTGTNNAELNISEIAQGIYTIVIKSNTTQSVQRLIVE